MLKTLALIITTTAVATIGTAYAQEKAAASAPNDAQIAMIAVVADTVDIDAGKLAAITGIVLDVAQAAALPAVVGRRRWIWAAAMPILWALGWTVTTLGGIDVAQQFTVFGAYGAVTFSASPAG